MTDTTTTDDLEWEDPFAAFDDAPADDGIWDLDVDLSFDDLGFDDHVDIAYDSATTCFDPTATSSDSAVSWDSGFEY